MPVEKKQQASAAFSTEVRQRLDEALAAEGCLWVTDADKTLWAGDIGEAFLRALAAEKVLVAPDAQGDVWASYEARVAEDRTRGYAWAVQAMAGLSEADVRERSRAFAEGFVPAQAFPAVQGLVDEAKARGCEIWVVSASSHWIVEAGVALMGLDPAKVLAMRVEVDDGVLTDRLVDPLTNEAGKVAAIEQRIGRRPTIVTGDSSGDFEMLDFAERVALLISQPGVTDAAYADHAVDRGWLVQPLLTPGAPQ